ncbi:unnamed protein product [Oppiella nova]|uniref:VWFA domain-containing protein n=1 Tax=Oppiella nova TaxID=334625 RepID=A0A7R9LGC7_9ACAR|nr:unnamed protein product [Oppiella nova]CAG2163317.1 unnamed protein product [Oppiella nova]
MSDRTVFVLDVSGSMAGAKAQTLHLQTVRFIERISDGNSVGIVLFNGKAWTVHGLTRLATREIRNAIIASVPQTGSGSTDIRAGIMEGLSAFSRAGVSTVGANMFLVSDGGHCCGNPDYVSDVLPHLSQAQVRVVCVAIGSSADPHLERLSHETKGTVYNISRVGADSKEMIARIMEAAMQEVITSKEMAEVVTISVVNEILTIDDSTDSAEIQVPIDPDIGRNTQIQVRSEDIKFIDIDITSPSGTTYSTNGGQVLKRLELKQCQQYMDETEPGVWLIKLNKHCGQAVRAHVKVESEATGVNAIQMNVQLRAPEADCPPIIVCTLSKANEPVVGAVVTATVDRPNETQTELPLNNYYEGFYYGYYTDYSGTGRYNVSVLATNSGNSTNWKASSFQIKDYQPSQLPSGDHFQELLLSNAFGGMRINSTSNGQAAGGTSASGQPTSFTSTSTKVTMISYLSSIKETSVEEVNSYQRRLDDINSKINLAKLVNDS